MQSLSTCISLESIEYSLKNVLVKAMFALTVFEILLFKRRSVLLPAQRVIGSERVKKQDSSISTSEKVYLFVFTSSFVSFGVCIYLQYFFDITRNQTSNKKYLLELIKSKSKTRGKNIFNEPALNLD